MAPSWAARLRICPDGQSAGLRVGIITACRDYWCHAPTRRSCSSAPSRAKLPPRTQSAAVSVRMARSVHHAHVVPPGAEQAQAAERGHASRGRGERVTQDTSTGSHSSPVRPATGTVASAP